MDVHTQSKITLVGAWSMRARSWKIGDASFLYGLLGVAVCGPCAHAAVTLTDLGAVPGGTTSYATGLSADGSVVCGFGEILGVAKAFRWTAGGMQLLPVVSGANDCYSAAISADGQVIAGFGFGGPLGLSQLAFRWSAGTGTVALSSLVIIGQSAAFGINGNGSILVGTVDNGIDQAFRWSPGSGYQFLGFLPTGSNAKATAITPDGSVIVGEGGTTFGPRVFRWTAAGGMQNLGGPFGATFSSANAVSSDGNTIVGRWSDSGIERPFRWTLAGGMQALPLPVGATEGQAWAVSADGSVVVGEAIVGSAQQAFVWTSAAGSRDLHVVLLERGVDVTGWTFDSARALSADGTTLAGYGLKNGVFRAWVAGGLTRSAACTQSDVAGPNQAVGSDGTLTADDIIVYLSWFFASDTRADIAGPNQSTTPDTNFTADDIIVFLSRYFAGC